MKASKKADKGSERTQVATRLEPEVYRKVAAAAERDGISVSSEVARRVARSFEANPAATDASLQNTERRFLAAFESAGQRQFDAQADDQRETPYRKWVRDPAAYTEAASRLLETVVEEHPGITYGRALRMFDAFRTRLDLVWRGMLYSVEDDKERQQMIESAQAMARQMNLSGTLSLLDPRSHRPEEKNED